MSLRLLLLVIVVALFSGCEDSKNSSPILSGESAITFVIDDDGGSPASGTVTAKLTLVDDGNVLNGDGSVSSGSVVISQAVTSNPDGILTVVTISQSKTDSDFNGTKVVTTVLSISIAYTAETGDDPFVLTVTASDGSTDAVKAITFTPLYKTAL